MVSLEPLAKLILSLVDWGITIITVMLLWECYKFVAGGSETIKEVAEEAGKKLWSFVPGTKAKAKRVTKKEMNEYITEADELERINEVKRVALDVVAGLEVLKKEQFSPRQVENVFKRIKVLGNRIKGAEKGFRGLNRRTSRAQTGIGRLFNYMKKKGLKNAELVQKVGIMEETILKLHQQTADELGKVRAEYGGILDSNAMKVLREEVEKRAASPDYAKAAGELADDFKKLAALLQKPYDHQTEAKQKMVTVISLTRSLM